MRLSPVMRRADLQVRIKVMSGPRSALKSMSGGTAVG